MQFTKYSVITSDGILEIQDVKQEEMVISWTELNQIK